MANLKRRPATGEKRKTNQPLKIDRLPDEVREAILDLRNAKGKTWEQIEELSALPKAKGGFVDWDALDLQVLELFPEMRLPHSNLHRWYDLRVSQVRRQVIAESEKARAFAETFVPKKIADSNAAVMNAMRDQVFTLMRNVGAGDRDKFLEGLNMLSLTLARLQRVDLQAKRVKVDQRRIRLLERREALTRRKLEAEAEKATKKLKRGELKPADLAELVQRTFGIAPPSAEAAHANA